jgi:nitrogen fixation protein NifZ
VSGAFGVGQNRFRIGDLVSAGEPLRQDGTFPDPSVRVGEVLVSAGEPGQIVDTGVYLQEHVVYAVLFRSGRLVGCLDHELALVSTEEVSSA